MTEMRRSRGDTNAPRRGLTLCMTPRVAASVLLVMTCCTPTEADPPAGRAVVAREPSVAAAPRPHLFVIRKDDAGLHRLDDGALANTGDLVQVGYVAAGHTRGVIVSVDGRGHVTLHHPSTPLDEARLRPYGPQPLGFSFELDDARAFERFFFVVGSLGEIESQRVIEATERLAALGPAAATAPLPLPSTWQQTSLLLRKPQ
jgi:hypothetical protein